MSMQSSGTGQLVEVERVADAVHGTTREYSLRRRYASVTRPYSENKPGGQTDEQKQTCRMRSCVRRAFGSILRGFAVESPAVALANRAAVKMPAM
jgi:hypothetical protein